jgi:hypothetical protein
MKRTIFFLYLITCSFIMLGCRTDEESIRIIDMYPTKGRFDPGEPVTVVLEIENKKTKIPSSTSISSFIRGRTGQNSNLSKSNGI